MQNLLGPVVGNTVPEHFSVHTDSMREQAGEVLQIQVAGRSMS